MNVYLAIAIVLIVFTLIGVPLLRRVVVNSVEDSLLRQDFAAFDRKIDKWYVKLFLSPFNVDFLKLNRAIMSGNRKYADQMFTHFDSVNLTDKEKQSVYLRGFEYYVSQEDRSMADRYYGLLKALDDEDLNTYIDRLYDIYVLKGWTYLDEMLAQEDSVPKDQLLQFYSMISAMYLNKGDDANVQRYLDKMESITGDMMSE